MERVLLAMSGGVDSSVAAVRLLEAGYEVIGYTFIAYAPAYASEAQRAERICSKLGIEHFTIDIEDEFEREIMSAFAKDYASGLTPNPCVSCNRAVKFPLAQRLADERGCKFISTGHYAIAEHGFGSGQHAIRKARHLEKDQSYVLYNLQPQQLERLLLPLGILSKPEVREIARTHGLESADAPDSQDVCFIEDGDYANFLKRYGVVCSPGDIVDRSGCILGSHDGLFNFTIGQRKGIGIAAPKPYYVIDKDIERNRLVVGFSEECGAGSCTITGVNWVSIERPSGELRVEAKTRYRQTPERGTLFELSDGSWKLEFDEPLAGVAPGHSAVFYGDGTRYDTDLLLGGGVISA
ncbi:MAG: tRNA 2-thiouridine(34) synthase MnmA [Coriobacteriales bacterium]|nr:tRNA 2-thiouridine(34) synthase MnmA [Coriobacteriales bacterium]